MGNDLSLDIGSGEAPKGDINVDIYRSKNVTVVADAQFLPFKDDCFGKINSSQLLEHLDDPRLCAKEVNRVLDPNGTATLDFPRKFLGSNCRFRILELFLNFPFSLLDIRKFLYRTNRIRTKDPRDFHKWAISPDWLDRYVKITGTERKGDILLHFLVSGRKARYFRKKPSIPTSTLCICLKR